MKDKQNAIHTLTIADLYCSKGCKSKLWTHLSKARTQFDFLYLPHTANSKSHCPFLLL